MKGFKVQILKFRFVLLTAILSLYALPATAQAQVQGGSCTPAPCVDLTWTDNSANEDGFRLQRRDNGGVFVDLAVSTAADIVALKDSTISIPAVCGSSNVYDYRIVAFNTAGSSEFSNTASIKFDSVPCPIIIPNAPSNLLAR